MLAIELDDASHRKTSRKRRDEFVDLALEAAQLPLLRVRAQKDYDPQELKQAVQNRLFEVTNEMNSESK